MKQILKGLLGCFIIIVSILGINKILYYVLVDDTGDEVKYAIQELYKQENIETLFLGSSHVMCGYIPEILDSGLNESIWLATTPVQRIDGSYHLLKEVLKKNDIKKVYLDMYYRQYRGIPEERTDDQMEYIYCITDNMNNSWNKVEFLLNASTNERYIESFFVPSRYGNYLLDLERFERIIKSKRSEEYRMNKGPENFCKGTTIVSGVAGNPKMRGLIEEFSLARIGDNIISEYSLKYLDRMVELCKKEGIELILVTTPFTYFHLAAMEDYTVYYEYMKEYADRNQIEYYDFNLCNNKMLTLVDEDFLDIHHLSGKGAEKYTKVFVDFINNNDTEERREFFYNTVEEKLKDMPRQTYGIVYELLDEEKGVYRVEAASNYPIEVEYRIVLLDSNGEEQEVIQEFSENTLLKKREGTENCFKVTVREKNSHEIYEEWNVYL